MLMSNSLESLKYWQTLEEELRSNWISFTANWMKPFDETEERVEGN